MGDYATNYRHKAEQQKRKKTNMKPRDSGMIERVTNANVAAIKGMGDMVYKPSHGIRLAPKEPDEVLVQRQLERWLDPGWCMTAPAGSESKVNRKRKRMLWWIAGVLML